MTDLILLVTALIWTPLIPLRPLLHSGIRFWRRWGNLSYGIFFLFWAIIDIALLAGREAILGWRFESSLLVTILGIVVTVGFLSFGAWTARTLGLITLSTRPQVTPERLKVPLIVDGPYRWIRHPIYFTEWGLLLGIALVTASWLPLILLAASLVIDPFVTGFEEKELVERFGQDYIEYQRKVPRLFPRLIVFLLVISPGIGGGASDAWGYTLRDPVREKGGIRYMITGVGESKSDPRVASFPLKLVFASNGSLYGDVNVRITDCREKTVFEVFSDGPWLLVQLPPGEYCCAATDPRQVSRTLRCPVGEGQKSYTLRWPP